jgi:hypothetical protein
LAILEKDEVVKRAKETKAKFDKFKAVKDKKKVK